MENKNAQRILHGGEIREGYVEDTAVHYET